MSFTIGPVFTSAGKELHARAVAGATLKFTKMQMGDGALGGASIDGLTALVHPVASVGISNLRHSGNFATIGGRFTNSDLTAGFYWREIGLFAADPDAPDDRAKDILYCYQNAGAMADFIPASESELITKRINISAIVDSATVVTADLVEVRRADEVAFDNETSTLEAEDVQAAIEELVQLTGKVSPHADTHKKGGSDPLKPGDFGAQEALEGTEGQYVGFNADGEAVAKNPLAGNPGQYIGFGNDGKQVALDFPEVEIPDEVAIGPDEPETCKVWIDTDEDPDVYTKEETNVLLADKAETEVYAAVLTTSWGSAAPYTQTVAIAGLLESDVPCVGVVLTGDVEADKIIRKAWANVSRIVTANGSITAYCHDKKPNVAIPVQVKVVR